MMRKIALACLFAFLAASAAAEPAPAWFLDNIERLTAESGTWLTSNAAYQNDDEPFVAYVIEWRAGLGSLSAYGTMFSIRKDDSREPIWEFVVYWHPGENRAVLQQVGRNGAFGTGAMHPIGDDRDQVVQQFYFPDGRVTTAAHETSWTDGVQDGRSFDVADDGAWLPRRHYIWRLQPVAQ